MTEENPNFPDPTDRASLESDRNFDNMKLYFRLPGRTSVIDARTGRVLTAAEVADIFKTVTTAVNKNNPFAGVAVAYADVKVTQFGPSKLVETSVQIQRYKSRSWSWV